MYFVDCHVWAEIRLNADYKIVGAKSTHMRGSAEWHCQKRHWQKWHCQSPALQGGTARTRSDKNGTGKNGATRNVILCEVAPPGPARAEMALADIRRSYKFGSEFLNHFIRIFRIYLTQQRVRKRDVLFKSSHTSFTNISVQCVWNIPPPPGGKCNWI